MQSSQPLTSQRLGGLASSVNRGENAPKGRRRRSLRNSQDSAASGSSRLNSVEEGELSPIPSIEEDALHLNELESSRAVGCCYLIKRCFRSLWATPQTGDAHSKKEFIKVTLRELFIYLCFLVVICIVTFGMVDSSMFYLTTALKTLFLNTNEANDDDDEGTFLHITNIRQLWKYLKGPLLTGLFWDTWYNKQQLQKGGYVYYQSVLLGTPRLRQLKVTSGQCNVHEDFRFITQECYQPYSTSLEDQKPFGPNNSWRYKTAAEIDGTRHWGMLATYSGGGYVQNLALTVNKSLDIIKYLENNGWITRGTRVIFIDFTLYNANVNLFSVIRLVVEFPVTGGAVVSSEFNTVKLIRYVNVRDYVILGFEVIAVLFLIYYMAEEYLEIKELGLAYFTASVWNYVDLGIIFIVFVAVIFSIVRFVVVHKKLTALLQDLTIYLDFESLGFWERRFSDVVAVTVFFAWIKIFKYISFNKTMTQLSSTLSRCSKDLAGFAIMFFIIFLAFTQLGYLLFGTQLNDFSTFNNSFFTLFRVLLGDFDYAALQEANSILGPIYFVAFIFFVFFILLNMFLAIINDTYSEVKSDLAKTRHEYNVSDYFKELFQALLRKVYFREVEAHHQLRLGNRELRFQEWCHYMRQLGRSYTEDELKALFDKYNVNRDDVLDIEEQKKMEEDLESTAGGLAASLKADYSDSDHESKRKKEPLVTQDEFMAISDRVDHLEVIVAKIIVKVDRLMEQLADLEILPEG